MKQLSQFINEAKARRPLSTIEMEFYSPNIFNLKRKTFYLGKKEKDGRP